MKILLGMFGFTAGFYLALTHLQQGLSNFYDFVAMVLVVIGSIAVSFMTIPALKFKYIARTIKDALWFNNTNQRKPLVEAIVTSLKSGGELLEKKKGPSQFARSIYNDGMEMVDLGFDKDKIKSILEKRIGNHVSDKMKVANWLKSMAKYPPALGLAATVMGMVHLMRGLSTGAGSEETGMRMAIALIATFYGIIVSNVFFAPLGERVKEELQESITLAELAIEGALLRMERSNLLVVQEELNSYLHEENRINVIAEVA